MGEGREEMLIQLHFEFKDHTEFVAQITFSTTDELRSWAHEISDRFPLPEGAQWMFCDEGSEHFVWAKEGKG